MQTSSPRWLIPAVILGCLSPAMASPVIDPISNASVPAGKSLIIPITATSASGLPLTYTVTSSTNHITVEVHTNNPFWKMSVVQLAASNAPGAFETPFRGSLATVTNIGDLTFLLFRDRAPRTVDAIAGLTAGGFYNSNTIFHRVVLLPYFIIQGGDPKTNGSGGSVFRYDDEIHPRSLYSGSGQLGSANSGPDTSGSQFFVTAAPQRLFDLRYTIFGQLVRGFNVLSNVLYTPTDGSSRPLADVIITRASLVTNVSDTVLTLTGTNLTGVAGTIQVVADDGAGGRATNSFTATTIADTINNQAILMTPAITNLLIPMNVRSTNFIQALDLEGNTLNYVAQFSDAASAAAATNSNIYANGALAIEPNPGYAGPLNLKVYVSQDNFATYDAQAVTFAVGDTPVVAAGTNFTAIPLVAFTNLILATFTNGVANSSPANFTAVINWGDNSINDGVIATNAGGWKEVRGSHTFTNSGSYPIYVTIRSALGAQATVVSTAIVLPSLTLTKLAPNDLLQWPAWAADFQPQFNTNLGGTTWTTLTNLPALIGYENAITNTKTSSNVFFRLKR